MNIRSWEGVTHRAAADAYTRYLEVTGVAELSSTPGCLGVEVHRRLEGERAIFRVESRWNSVDAMRRFAGEDPTVAVFFPEDAAFLVERDERVLIWEVVAVEPSEAGRPRATTTEGS